MAGKKQTAAERRAELEAEIAALEAEEAADDDDVEYWIERGDNRASVPARSRAGKKIAGFFKESFGIDLSDEPVQDDDAGDDDSDGKPAARRPRGRDDAPAREGSAVVRFGRRAG